MICKERDSAEHLERDKFSAAGAKAEEQMAFYLRRAFFEDPDVWVFNDLRFQRGTDDFCQIDHLVVHRSGFILIESKSVTSKVRILRNEEWERLWNNHWQGMPSPIKQAERQVDFLRDGLHADREQLLGTLIMGYGQMGFKSAPFEILVAISDTGSIDRKGSFPQVNKADLIPDRIREIVKRHKNARGLFSMNVKDGVYNFKAEEVEAIRQWFVAHHYPITLVAQPKIEKTPVVAESRSAYVAGQPSPISPQSSISALGRCEKCGAQCSILWGKFGYYWKCPQCQSNMPIKEHCPSCQGKIKLRKDKQRFYKYCDQCKTPEVLYHESA